VAALLGNTALAHYGMIIPSDNMVEQGDGASIDVTLSFSHPFEGEGMILEQPLAFSVTHEGRTLDLLRGLRDTQVMGTPAFMTEYLFEEPGTYVFAMEPQPYWEQSEGSFIIHYTKTYVSAFGEDNGWDTEIGLRTEIVPMSKPFGLWAGNVFQGVVMLDGAPVPNAEVEVEFYNEDGTATVPSDLMITQTVKADANGVFTYATPSSGWWGFAALNTAPETMVHQGQDRPVELGAVLWVRFEDWAGK
jgi:cobalt/nickel transport protein